MNGYGILLGLHSNWRWGVLVLGLVALVRSGTAVYKSRPFTAFDERASRLFVAALDIQMLLGLILYAVFSPFISVVYQSFQVAMKNQTIRFFGLEHQTAMLLGVIAVHVGRDRVKRATEAAAKHRALLVSSVIFFTLALWAIPWPWRAIGRPLFRSLW